MFSFMDDLRANHSNIVEMCSGKTRDGQPFHAFIEMTPDRYREYQNDLKSGQPIDLTIYGEIIHTGWGYEPDHETQMRILRDHTDNLKILAEMQRQTTNRAGETHGERR